MKRRSFVTRSSAAVAGIMTVPALSCAKSIDVPKANTSGADLVDDFELNEVTVDWLQEQMVNEKYTSAGITQLYLNRIDALDKNGPKLNAVIELNPDALEIAKTMDAERK